MTDTKPLTRDEREDLLLSLPFPVTGREMRTLESNVERIIAARVTVERARLLDPIKELVRRWDAVATAEPTRTQMDEGYGELWSFEDSHDMDALIDGLRDLLAAEERAR